MKYIFHSMAGQLTGAYLCRREINELLTTDHVAEFMCPAIRALGGWQEKR